MTYAGALIAAAAVGLIRFGLHWIGSKVVGWWLYFEFEMGMVGICFVLGGFLGWLISPGSARQWAIWGAVGLVIGMFAHILVVRSLAQADVAVTSTLFVVPIVGMIAFTAGLARLLAESHMRSVKT